LLAIRGVTLIDGTGTAPQEDVTVLIRGEEIARVGPAAAVRIPAGAHVVDGRGRYLIPGLIDTHAHLTFGEDLDFLLPRLFLPNGITTIRDAGIAGSPLAAVRMRDTWAAARTPARRIYVSGCVDGRNVLRQELSDARELTRRWIDAGVDGIKIRPLDLGMDDVRAVIEEAHAAGLPVFGHTWDLSRQYTTEMIRSGYDGIMHVLGIPPPDRNPKPEPVEGLRDWEAYWLAGATAWLQPDEAEFDALIQLMIDHEVWLEPTLTTEASITEAHMLARSPAHRYLPD